MYINHDYDLSFVLHTEARDFENWANPDYYFTYDNPEVQDLYAQSLAATDPDEAADLLKQAARIVVGGRRPPTGSTTAPRSSRSAAASAGCPITNVNERLNLAELTKSDG